MSMSTAQLQRLSAVALASLVATAGCGPVDEPDAAPSCVSGCDDGQCDTGEWVPICPGTFTRLAEVTLTRGFEILSTEVTQAQFEELMGYNPSMFSENSEWGWAPCGPDCPVEWVTWHEAVQYCNALSEREGLEPCYVCTGTDVDARCDLAPGYETPYECEGYRLPTEAEWEYAARAGTTTDTYAFDLQWGISECDIYPTMHELAWYCDVTPHPVAALLPNSWGLYDVIGNVSEFTADHLCGYFEECEPIHTIPEEPVTDPYFDVDWPVRIHRGCGWANELEDCKISSVGALEAAKRDVEVGFRPVRTRLDIGAEEPGD